MSTAGTDVLIVGAGVSGLTTGVFLAERGTRVRIRTARGPLRSTSAAAGAIWDPNYAAHPKMAVWSAYTRKVFAGLHGEAGVRLIDGMQASRIAIPPPAWAKELPGFRKCEATELPDGFASGWRYTAILDMPTYLTYLRRRLSRTGGKIEYGRLRSLDDAFTTHSIVVNCAGSAARELVPDPDVTPSRGQLVLVRNPGIREFFAEHVEDLRETIYLLPQGRVLVLGGSADEEEDDPVVDMQMARRLRERCIDVFPEVAKAEVLGCRVGIRPKRCEVRLEHESRGARHIVHNYGHSGSGVSLSWGCAAEAADLVDALLL